METREIVGYILEKYWVQLLFHCPYVTPIYYSSFHFVLKPLNLKPRAPPLVVFILSIMPYIAPKAPSGASQVQDGQGYRRCPNYSYCYYYYYCCCCYYFYDYYVSNVIRITVLLLSQLLSLLMLLLIIIVTLVMIVITVGTILTLISVAVATPFRFAGHMPWFLRRSQA